MPLLPFEQRLAEAWPPESWRDVSVLIAVSGGPDSMALLRGLHRLKESNEAPTASAAGAQGRLIIGHFNHRLRPDADEDEAFVREQAAALNLPCETARGDPAALDMREGLESAAREARYRFLQETAERQGARYIAVAHTADDQVETILHHIIRGTGLAGLSGMPRVRSLSPAVTLVRPLLGIRRSEVEDYLRQIGQPFRTDPTNLSTDLTRNRIRHELLPLLSGRFNREVVQAILRLGSLAGEAQEVLSGMASQLMSRAVTDFPDGEVRVDCRLLDEQPRYVVREMFCQIWRQRRWPMQDMTQRHWDELAALAASARPPVPRTFPGGLLAARAAGELRLSPGRQEP